jgi:hypothetical protein
VLPDDAAVLDTVNDPGAFVVAALDRAKSWLAQATTADLPEVVEQKARAEAIRCYMAQKELGHDAELAAQEIVRRAERRIGVLIREGQEAGEIRRNGQHANAFDQIESIPSPYDIVSLGELSGARGDGIYALTDGVDDEMFDVAIESAKEEGNLSRANVARKVKAAKNVEGDVMEKLVEAAKKHPPKPKRHELLRKTRHIDPVRVVNETVTTLEGAVLGIGLLNEDDLAGLPPDQVVEWATSLKDSIKQLNRFVKEMTRERP